MKAAKPTDWRIEALPESTAKIRLGRAFTKQEMKQIRKGLVPQQMEDKWFIYWENDCLYFHRSWTGHCIYVARFMEDAKEWRMIDAVANRDAEQYSEAVDEIDAQQISGLIDVLLLHREAQ